MLSTFRTKIKFLESFYSLAGHNIVYRILWMVFSFPSTKGRHCSIGRRCWNFTLSAYWNPAAYCPVLSNIRKDNFERSTKNVDFDELAINALVFDVLLDDAARRFGNKNFNQRYPGYNQQKSCFPGQRHFFNGYLFTSFETGGNNTFTIWSVSCPRLEKKSNTIVIGRCRCNFRLRIEKNFY